MRKLQRTVHTHSYIERQLLHFLEYQNEFVDLLDQWPIPREVSLGAARALGVRHPRYPVTRVPMVMTFDFLCVFHDAAKNEFLQPYDCKMTKYLDRPRVQELLSIHRAAAEHLGMRRPILFTERTLPRQVVRNIAWVRGQLPHPGEPQAVHELFLDAPSLMHAHIAESRPDQPIWSYCKEFDEAQGWQPGVSLRVMSYLLWMHRLEAKLDGPDIPLQPVPLAAYADVVR